MFVTGGGRLENVKNKSLDYVQCYHHKDINLDTIVKWVGRVYMINHKENNSSNLIFFDCASQDPF